MLTQVEIDLISFLSERTGEEYAGVEKRYLRSKSAINFSTRKYKEWCRLSYRALNVFFHDETPETAIDSYRHFAYPDLLRMVSYSFPGQPPTLASYAGGYWRALQAVVREKRWSEIGHFIVRKIRRQKRPVIVSPAAFLMRHLPDHVSIVDYGCGLAYLSFQIAKSGKIVDVTLVDVDSIKLDFAEYRFKKHGLNPTVIRITKDNLYPPVPSHTLCIATEVMEHLHEPLRVYKNIESSLQKDGLFYGDVHDHEAELFHVHPHLADVRAALEKDFTEIGPSVYRKR